MKTLALTEEEKIMEDADRQERHRNDPWRAEMAGRMGGMEDRMGGMEDRHADLKRAVDLNTTMTATVMKNTNDIVEFFEAGRGTFKFLKMLGGVAKWFTAIAAAIAVAVVYFKTGGKP